MLSRNLKGLQIHVVHRGEMGNKKRFKVSHTSHLGSDCQIVGLSSDPAAAIHFEEDHEEGAPVTGKKKISLLDYFYVKVSYPLIISANASTIVASNNLACPASPSGKTLSCPWRFCPISLISLTSRSARLLPVNVLCASSTNVRLLRSSRSPAPYFPSHSSPNCSLPPTGSAPSKKALPFKPTKGTRSPAPSSLSHLTT